ncbi:hypothetical protein MSG28_012312 [Choristoneura fumiferana]|uniref:Uncharacterized protein n=1 Tax=Choristoneura fumiferana TaxID=7141 RepID=A0ACC0KDA7_CHOFU|nr:hypothetical protein MSG28_012312 [Choristoneura fumiferana]
MALAKIFEYLKVKLDDGFTDKCSNAFSEYLFLTYTFHQSEELINAVYELPWEYMNTSNRRTVMFFLYKVQTPMSLKAMKVVPVGIQTMAGILKTSLSYFMMLTTVAAGD